MTASTPQGHLSCRIGKTIGAALAGVPSMAVSSSSSSSLGGHQEFHRLIREADEAHRQLSMAAHEVRWLELDLNATKVVLAASEGVFATA